MKKILLSLMLLILLSGLTLAQSPEAINYQAVARDGSGALLSNAPLTVKLGIYSGAGGSTQVYEETHSVTTNQFGLFSLKIGKGTVTFGTFAGIFWADDEHYLKVEADPGSGYADLGMSQLVAVPYSYYADQSLIATDMALQDLTDVSGGGQVNGDVLTWNGTDWAPAAPSGGSPWIAAGNNLHYDLGYVGIGTASPGAGLSLESAAGYGSAVALKNTVGGLEWRLTSWTDGKFRLVKTTGTTFSALSVEPLNGDVGIGTDLGDMALNVHRGSGISYIRVSDNTSGPTSGLRMGMSGSGNAYIINDETTKSLSLGTGGTTKLRITDLGYVGINELNPDVMLHVKQSIPNQGFQIEHQSSTDNWRNGVGTTTKNYKFYFNNLIRADISSTDGSYIMGSDRRLKHDIAPIGSVLDKVMQLQPSTYYYNGNRTEDPRSLGFVAQEVEVLFPDLVREVDDGYKGVVYDGFAVISIRAIQELNEKIERLQAEVDALKGNSEEGANR